MPARIANNPATKQEWERLSAVLLEQQVLTPQFGDLLGLFVETNVLYERRLRDLALMNGQSVIVQTQADKEARPRSRVILNPLLRALRSSQETTIRLAAEFGVSPASVAKVARDDPHADDAAERFLASRPPAPVVRFPKVRRPTGTDDDQD